MGETWYYQAGDTVLSKYSTESEEFVKRLLYKNFLKVPQKSLHQKQIGCN